VAQILDGRSAAAALEERLGRRIGALRARGVEPGLVMLRVGDDPASMVYVRSKEKACARLGIRSRTVVLAPDVTREALQGVIAGFNADASVHGLLLQLPLPGHLAQEELLAAIDPAKDVDGFHPVNLGRLCLGLPCLVGATPLGILRLLQHHAVSTAGKAVVILGRSRVVGRPLANLLSQPGPDGNATVTLCHSATRDLPAITRRAEILIVAIGRPRFVTAAMVAPGMQVIDVGMHREPDAQHAGKTRLCGDVDYASVEPIVEAISPVPGGVGLMTVACLMENTVLAAEWAAGAGG
jgi:methylenetetrahydrofolate dehydrogenase (NADP+) / methenyltetrahydrofolate cyclohydrolase